MIYFAQLSFTRPAPLSPGPDSDLYRFDGNQSTWGPSRGTMLTSTSGCPNRIPFNIVDGRNPKQPPGMYKTHSILYMGYSNNIWTISTGAGFLPSTVRVPFNITEDSKIILDWLQLLQGIGWSFPVLVESNHQTAHHILRKKTASESCIFNPIVVQANRRFFVVHPTSNYRTTASQLRQQKTQQIPSLRSPNPKFEVTPIEELYCWWFRHPAVEHPTYDVKKSTRACK